MSSRLLDAGQIDWLVETMHKLSNGTSRMATGAVGKNIDLENHSFVVRSRRDGETCEAREFDELCTLLE